MSRGEFAVALVGRPNVGKSTLFNRIARKRRAITFDQPGITRDLVAEPVEYDGRRFLLVDTGGYMPGGDDDLLPKIRGQVLRAVYESDLVVFLVDARDGLLPLDKEIAGMLREREKPFLLAANKVDAKEGREGVSQFHALSVDRIFPVSSEHGTGVSDLLEEIVARIPAQTGTAEETDARAADIPRIAVVGRPNVGKSTMVNTLAGFERVIASEIPGTTRDSIDVLVERDGRKYQLIDTAGIRAKRKTGDAVEIFSVMKSLESIKRCDLAILLIDGPAGLSHQDRQVLRYILNEERAVVVAANKSDGWKTEEERRKAMRVLQEGLDYASFAPVVPTVATSGKGFAHLFRKIEEASANFRLRVPTGLLNRMAQSFLYTVPIPSQQGRNRAFYITQVGVAPPSFAVFVKDRRGIPDSFTRYLQNKIRDRFGFEGSPVRIVYRER
ncbi:MAG TPA: ribosome biogenesis GTPase Der [Candidatus Methylomirabilis sp.]|nr:ribosome biogenesis GTPase Der [Candidatus Methylomirabilis sp.]